MRRPFRRVLILAAFLAVGGCEQEDLPLSSGTPSTLTVRAYVDADGDGSFSGGDVGIASATVTTTGPGGALEATTDGDGRATFQGLAPGSYRLSLTGPTPSGAVLATSSAPVVVAPYRGGELSAEFRYAFKPGSISGQVYRDDNDNGVFDPGTDLSAAGIRMTLLNVQEEVVRETTTDAQGSYTFEQVRPGSYFVRITPLETMEIVGSAQQNVVVSGDEAAALSFRFTGTLVIGVATARSAPDGQTVTIQGVVSWAPSFDGRQLFVQDETGGISVFDFDLATFAPAGGFAVGDRVELTGTRGSFDGEVQVGGLVALEHLGSGAPPVPVQVTVADIAAGSHLGELVSINGTVEQVDVLSFGNQMVLLRDDEGGTFAVKVDSRTGVEEDTWEIGVLYGVTGVLGTDVDESDTEIEADHPDRVEVRSPDDVQRGGATTPIADARQNLGATVVVQGVVTFAPGYDDRVIFFQDATGGISVFDFDLADFAPAGGFQRGQLIRMIATVGAFGGETQLEDVEGVEALGVVPVPGPQGTTGAKINAGEDQGELVTTSGTVTDVQVLNFGNQLVSLTDDEGASFNVYADSRTGVEAGDWVVAERFRVTGVLGTDDGNDPAARVEVRGDDDVVQVGAGTVSIAEARAMFGQTVTIRGTVSRVIPWNNREAYVQDETGGITLFTFDGLPAGIAAGDVVTVTGEVGAFNGELQIGPDAVTIEGQTDIPAPLEVTGAQVNDGLFQGSLVSLSGTVTAVEVINQFGTQEVTVLAADGASVTVFVDNRTGLAEEDWTIGEAVTVVGVLGFFDDNDPGAQLEVILGSDVTFGP